MPHNTAAIMAGGIRLASGLSFLAAPEPTNRLWGGDPEDMSPTTSLLLRSMGYRDALIGGLLLQAGLRDHSSATGWFLASAGADLADLVGGLANHDRMTTAAKWRGIGGAAIGIASGLSGAVRTQHRLGQLHSDS